MATNNRTVEGETETEDVIVCFTCGSTETYCWHSHFFTGNNICEECMVGRLVPCECCSLYDLEAQMLRLRGYHVVPG